MVKKSPWCSLPVYCLLEGKYFHTWRVHLMLTLFWTGFKLGSEKHTVEVVVNSDGDAKVTSGVSELSLLKTTQVEFSSACVNWST